MKALYKIFQTMKFVFALLFLAVVAPGLTGSATAPGNVLFCDICVDIGTDIDQFLVSNPTEQAVIEFVSQVNQKNNEIDPWVTQFIFS